MYPLMVYFVSSSFLHRFYLVQQGPVGLTSSELLVKAKQGCAVVVHLRRRVLRAPPLLPPPLGLPAPRKGVRVR